MWMECDLTLKQIQKIDPNYEFEYIDDVRIEKHAVIKYKSNILAELNEYHCYWYLKGIFSGLVNEEVFR